MYGFRCKVKGAICGVLLVIFMFLSQNSNLIWESICAEYYGSEIETRGMRLSLSLGGLLIRLSAPN